MQLAFWEPFLDVPKVMNGRCKQISDSYIVKSSSITIGKDKIGTGNFADVYKGTYQKGKEEKVVAVKIVRVGGGNVDAEMHCLAELKNEALIMSLHRHRCVIEFFGISSDKIPMILMEYCAGGALDLHLQMWKERILTADGMRYLERKKCIHRDLATRNVLISNTGCLKIGDFGLSRSPIVAAPKETGHAHIPIRWMAPETLVRTPVYSSKSDVWSFGIVTYEIFNFGQKPWPEKPAKWIATKIRKGITAEMPKRMPRLIREIVSACFKLEPEQRPTFRQVNSRIRLIQRIRFPPLQPRTMSLARLKNVKPSKFIDKDPEEIVVELNGGREDKIHEDDDDDDNEIQGRQLTEESHATEITKDVFQNDDQLSKWKAAPRKIVSTESDDDEKYLNGSADAKMLPDERIDKDQNQIRRKRKT